MHLIPILLGAGVVLVGLALATNHRGIAQRIVDTQLNPANADTSVLRIVGRLGSEHPGMDFSRAAPRLRVLVRGWGAGVALIGLGFLTVGIALLVRV